MDPLIADPVPTRRVLLLRALECAAMFIVAPAVLAIYMRPGLVFPAIWTLALICFVVLLRDRSFARRQLWNAGAIRTGWRIMGIPFAIGAPLLGLGLLAYEPDRLFSLPRRNPVLWGIIMVGYPVLSVYAQELAFRAYFFHRYAPIFRSRWAMILASALAFGYAHIILHNWIAVAFTTVGGVLFGATYDRTRSLFACCIEHALYGCFLFTIGWGWYFYGGSVGRS